MVASIAHAPISSRILTTEQTLRSIPGGQELLEWFGRPHRFHDAELFQIALVSDRTSSLHIRTWEMTDKVDERGYYILQKHVAVTIYLDDVTDIALSEFSLHRIIFDLIITPVEPGWKIVWESSFGVSGTVRANRIRIELDPAALGEAR